MQKLVSTKGKRALPSPAYGKTAIKVAIIVFVVVVALLNLFTHVFSVVRYYGDGMEPALQNGQILLIRKTDKAGQGDIIAFYYNNKVLVRRVICTGGSAIDIDTAGLVRINGTPLEEPYVDTPSIGQSNVSYPLHVSIGQYFVMGDNRAIAMDSRLTEIGTIPEDRVLGKVILTLG